MYKFEVRWQILKAMCLNEGFSKSGANDTLTHIAPHMKCTPFY